MTAPVQLAEASVPRLAPGAKLQHDKRRGQWIVQAPERVFVPDQIALEILKRCDGEASIAAIVDDLAQAFTAPRQVILADVLKMLQDLADKNVVAA